MYVYAKTRERREEKGIKKRGGGRRREEAGGGRPKKRRRRTGEADRQTDGRTERQRQTDGKTERREKGISTELYNIVENENCHSGAHRQKKEEKRREERGGGGGRERPAQKKVLSNTGGAMCVRAGVWVCVQCACESERDGVRDPVKHRDRRDPEA